MKELAELIFNHRHDPEDLNSPIALWADQSPAFKQRYIQAAQIASIVASNGAYSVLPITDIADPFSNQASRHDQ